MRNFLKFLSHLITILGVLIAFANLKGWFIDNDRIYLYNQLTTKIDVSFNDKGVLKFLKKYYNSEYVSTEMMNIQIQGLTTKWIAIGDNRPMSGTVHVKFVDGRRTTPLCTFDELRAWSKEAPFYSWLGWWFLVFGLGVRISLDYVDYLQRRFALVSAKDGTLIESNNFPWNITKVKDKEGNIVYIINERFGDATQIKIKNVRKISYKIYNANDGVAIKFLCEEVLIPNFRIYVS